MKKESLVLLLLGVTITAVVSGLVVTLLPRPAPSESAYEYRTAENGSITWLRTTTEQEMLLVRSALLKKTSGVLRPSVGDLECGDIRTDISEVPKHPGSHVQCWNVISARGGAEECSPELKFPVKDCLSMRTSTNELVYWFGGAEMVTQKWPINEVALERGAPFLSSDLPKRMGNVLERYYVSSRGAAVFIDPGVPLRVSMLPNTEICIEASHEDNWLVGPGYLPPNENAHTTLSYTVCIGDDAKTVHQAMTHKDTGFIQRPSELPDLRMMKHPIWSTWARYKADINQTVVEKFADEIIAHNFTNSQLEIDDGYEKAYGDFSFDSRKFPNAKGMVDSLHEKGFRVTMWTTPFINLNSVNYRTVQRQGYFVPESSDGSAAVIRWWNGRGSTIDFSNVDAASWYQSLLRDAQKKFGIDSFKFDAGETSYLPKAGMNYTAVWSANPSVYTTEYAKAAFEVGGKMMEMRSSWKTQNRSFFMRLMDKGSSWGALRGFQTVIPAALTFGILGYPFVLPDMIGGNVYVFGTNNDNKPERELYIRWVELSAFLPCMQFSISPWQYDEEVTRIAQYYVELHQTIVYDEVVAAASRYLAGEMSLPVAPLWFHSSSSDEAAVYRNDEFLVGDRYLVAPILEKGATKRDIYLPGGSDVKWKDKMRAACSTDNDSKSCIVDGGTWIYSYRIELNQISWWEKLS